MGIDISERKARPPTVGGFLLPEESLRIRRKATRTSVFCLYLMVFFFRGVGGRSVETWLFCGDLFKDSNLDVTGIEGTRPAAA